MLARCNTSFPTLRNLDRLFNDFPTFQLKHDSVHVDVREDEGHMYLDVELPGWSKDDVAISLENNVLVIEGQRKDTAEVEGQSYHIRERRCGAFKRSFQLPDVIDANTVGAILENGILTVTLDKREEVKPRQIEVKVK